MHHPIHRFEGIWLPLITPFRDGAVDLAAARLLVDFYAGAGVHGLVICGTTGEAATLSADEKLRWLDAVLDAAAGRLPVAMGTGSSDTAASVRALAPLNARPLAGLLVTPPAYTRPSQAGIRAHLAAIAQATPHAVMLYNIPYRTGVNIDLDTVQSLCELPNVAAIKESGGNLNQLMDLIAQTRLDVLAGEDHLIFTTLCLGGRGAIAAAAHLRPHWHVAVYEAVRRGDWLLARELSAQLLPLVRLLFEEPNPAPIKALLAQQGLIADELRLPMLPASRSMRAQLDRVLAALPEQPPTVLRA
ncbi:MAG: 4-hydroxy-tetrahydrodipicolinate synthase [Nevskiaceae bacterium]|nr:MAG: 4-hydroxy-tetrahydrodipicolinate synthase [Nevskiaceae bacterium]